jgi:hypothetical protein
LALSNPVYRHQPKPRPAPTGCTRSSTTASAILALSDAAGVLLYTRKGVAKALLKHGSITGDICTVHP